GAPPARRHVHRERSRLTRDLRRLLSVIASACRFSRWNAPCRRSAGKEAKHGHPNASRNGLGAVLGPRAEGAEAAGALRRRARDWENRAGEPDTRSKVGRA